MPIDATIRSAGWALPRAGGYWNGDEVREESAPDIDGLFENVVLSRRDVKNYGRFPEGTRAVCCACALGFEAAGYWPGGNGLAEAGIVAAVFDRTLARNYAFFEDYVANGRVMGRGNLFIYTLPTSAIAEAAILFGAEGPVLHEQADRTPFSELIAAGGDFLASGQAAMMALLWQDDDATVCGVLTGTADAGLPAERVAAPARTWQSPREAVQYFRTHNSY